MKRILPLLVLARCGGNTADVSYQQITQETAKEMMDTWEGVIMNVREQDEYDSGHIPDAVLQGVLSTRILPMMRSPRRISRCWSTCRSGNRSKTASLVLAELGYTNIYAFGGINTWSYETEL